MRLEELLGPLRGFPNLDGARCIGRWYVFDETDDPDVVEYAVHQCLGCPALTACREWFDGLRPSHRPEGVVAGKLHRNRKQVAA